MSTLDASAEDKEWVESQIRSLAAELDLTLDEPPYWNNTQLMDHRITVQIGGQRQTMTLSRADVQDINGWDTQGDRNAATCETREKVRKQLKALLSSFVK